MMPGLPPLTLSDIGYGWSVAAPIALGAAALCIAAAVALIKKGK